MLIALLRSNPDAFIAAIADCLRQPSAALTLLRSERAVLATAASDATSRVAQSLELTLGEGPAHDVGVGRPVSGGTDTIVTYDLAAAGRFTDRCSARWVFVR